MRSWEKDDLFSSFSSKTALNLLDEVTNKNSKRNPALKQFKKLPYPLLRKRFYSDTALLNWLDNEFMKETFSLYKRFPLLQYNYFRFSEEEIPNEYLFEFAYQFFTSLHDRQITKEIDSLFTKKKSHILIKEKEDCIYASKYIKGQCIYNYANLEAFVEIYKTNTITDFLTFAHEIAHYLKVRIFKKDLNPLIANYLTEVDGNLFYLLAICALPNIMQIDESYCSYLIATQIVDIINSLWILHYQTCIFPQFKFHVSPYILKKKFQENKNFSLTKEDLPTILTARRLNQTANIQSFFCALEFFEESLNDMEKALYNYKLFMSSPVTTLAALLQEHTQFRNNDYALFMEYATKAKELTLK